MNNKITFYETLHKNNMMYFILVGYISSDNICNIETAESSLKSLKELKEILPLCKNIDEKSRNKYLDYVEKGINIVERDLNEFRKEKENA